MWVKEVIVDGFKSYANRTVISEWDPSFNAITGLNGSGKSNILDSICFVLGISNLSQVRVNNLQELVYKKGKSHVHKASVSVVFDNADKAASPVGYEEHDTITVTRQVVIGGRNKYLINGHSAQMGRVQNLFHSVQLNVNNPHFLIMQGRITKVVNMKPPEVLGMIEEAAGTRMYETKKLAALKTIGKKQVKVDEINKILVEEITPTLAKLKKERSSYITWSSNKTEIERLDRFRVAHQFHEAEEVAGRSRERLEGLQGELEELEERRRELASAAEDKRGQIALLQERRQEEMRGPFERLQKAENEESVRLVKTTSKWKHRCEALDAEERALAELAEALAEAARAVEAKEAEITEHTRRAAEARAEFAALEERMAALQSQQLGIDVGEDGGGHSSGSSSESGTLAGQLMQAQREAGEAESEATGLDTEQRHHAAAAAEHLKRAKACKREHAGMAKSLAAKEAELGKVDARLAEMKYDPDAREAARGEAAALEERVSGLAERADDLEAHLAHLDFDFASPSARFDRSRVKGLVARLIKVKEQRCATALEVAAGGRLYNVVVDTQATGKELLQKGKLRRRVTIIPLDRIRAGGIRPEAVRRAQELVGAENARVALSLVGYDDEVEAAMGYVFGGTFVCPDSDSAKRVTFDKGVRARSVTHEGDVFSPQGTLTGGSAPQGGSVLLKLERLAAVQDELAEARARLAALRQRLAAMDAAAEGASEDATRRELLCHEVALLRTRLAKSEFARLGEEAEAARARAGEAAARAEDARGRAAAARERAASLERSIEDFDRERKSKAKELEAEVKAGKRRLATMTAGVKQAQQATERLEMELASLREEAASLEEQRGAAAAALEETRADAERLAAAVKEAKEAHDAASGRVREERKRMRETDRSIERLGGELAEAEEALTEAEVAGAKLKNTIGRHSAEKNAAAARVERMLKEFEWVAQERHLFGREGTDYDFGRADPREARRRLEALKEQQKTLSSKINTKVMGMFEKAEQEYHELMRKRDIIEADKAKIEQVITELDRQKNEALERTWRKVTKDFSSIFSTLLPGADARLRPPEGKTVLDGLEVHVGFGGSWKESLSELSGGQRSLLALSLILALLLFKPAPMYILDEIDAALDLSHTQNIGQMLKTHFPQSQFIVVSLKEGMFNNANVIFRTKFVDGVSTVQRSSLVSAGRR